MRWLLVMTLAACGDASYQLETPSRFDDCYAADCPMALGGSVYVSASLDTDVEEILSLHAVTVEPPALAGIEVHDDYFIVTPELAGLGTLRVTLADGKLMERRLRTAPVATTTIVIDGLPDAPGDFALLAGSMLQVYADHRDAQGEHMLGSGLEVWSATGGTIVNDLRVDRAFDDGIGRTVTATDPGRVAISTGDTTLAIDVEPLGSTRQLALVGYRDDTVTIGKNEYASIELRAFDAAQRLLLGGGPITVAVGDPTLVTAKVYGRQVTLSANHATGTTTLAIHFDGATLSRTLVLGEY